MVPRFGRVNSRLRFRFRGGSDAVSVRVGAVHGPIQVRFEKKNRITQTRQKHDSDSGSGSGRFRFEPPVDTPILTTHISLFPPHLHAFFEPSKNPAKYPHFLFLHSLITYKYLINQSSNHHHNMSRRVRRKVAKKGKEKLLLPSYPELNPDGNDDDFTFSLLPTSQNSIKTLPITLNINPIDWTTLPHDTVIQLFSLLNYRDRASLASSCKTWRNLGSTPCLWDSLDLRAHRCDVSTALSLSSRCSKLRRLRFLGSECGDAIIHLKARNLREISGDYCRKMTDATLSVIAARHEFLESLQLGPDFCERISSDAIRAVAVCCPRLRRISLSGVREIDSDAINSLAMNCVHLSEIGFMDCLKVDETALGNVGSLRFLCVAGTSNLKWGLVSHLWSKLPNLVGLDVSRTDIGPTAVSRLLLSCQSLKVLCALNCTSVEEDSSFVMSSNGSKGKLLLSLSNDIRKGVSSLFVDNSMKGRNVFLDWRGIKRKDKRLDEIMTWLEWVLSYSLLRIAESNPPGLDNFWVSQGATLLLSLMQSSQEDVQERAATGLATFVVVDDENTSIDSQRAEAVMRGGGVQLLLKLASSWREGLQAESAKVRIS